MTARLFLRRRRMLASLALCAGGTIAALLWQGIAAAGLVLAAAVVTWNTVPLVAALSRAAHAVVLPGGRSIHRRTTPLLGGLTLYLPIALLLGWGAIQGHVQDLGLLLGRTNGGFSQVWGDVKAILDPSASSHPVARAGATFFHAKAETTTLDKEGDYLGLYVSVGWEWDLGSRFSTGPEFGAMLVTLEDQLVPEFLPRLAWNFVWKF